MDCDDPAKLAAIKALKPGIHYRPGTRRPYRNVPADFAEKYKQWGYTRDLSEYFGCNDYTIRRWIDESGGDQLRAARSAVSGLIYQKRRSRYPTYTEAVAAIVRGEEVPAIPRRVPHHRPKRLNDELYRLAIERGYRLRFSQVSRETDECHYSLTDQRGLRVRDPAPANEVRAWLEREPVVQR